MTAVRERFSRLLADDDGLLYLGEPEPFGYVEMSDTIRHVVRDGDTLWTISARYYAAFERPAGFWSIIAAFQPEPIVDPTLRLTPGTVLYVPSPAAVNERILAATRRNQLGEEV